MSIETVFNLIAYERLSLLLFGYNTSFTSSSSSSSTVAGASSDASSAVSERHLARSVVCMTEDEEEENGRLTEEFPGTLVDMQMDCNYWS